MRLIRSKGVGVFFVTQTPRDVPSGVLSQLGNRVQHALRAFTPEDAKALKATVSTFPRSGYDLGELLTTLGTGEAVVTVLSDRGAPTPVAWTRMRAPQSLMAPSPAAVVSQVVGVLAADRAATPRRSTASRPTSGCRHAWPRRPRPSRRPPRRPAPTAPTPSRARAQGAGVGGGAGARLERRPLACSARPARPWVGRSPAACSAPRAAAADGLSKSAAGMAARHAVAGPSYREFVQVTIAQGRLADTFVDTTCDRPRVFTFGGMIGHVITFGAVRRTLVLGALESAGVTDLGAGDPMHVLDAAS